MKILKQLLESPSAQSWVQGAFQQAASEALGSGYEDLTIHEARDLAQAADELGALTLRSLKGEDVAAELVTWAGAWKGMDPVVLAAFDVDVSASKDAASEKLGEVSTLVKDPTAYETAKK